MCECENCRYCRKHYVGFSRQSKRTEYYCNHEDQGQIEKYFRERKLLKMPGLIGFSKPDGSFPVKNTPKWCPKKEVTAAR